MYSAQRMVLLIRNEFCRGSGVAARLANFNPERFIAFTFIGLGYNSPAADLNVRKIMELTKKTIGYELYGYVEYVLAHPKCLMHGLILYLQVSC